MIIIRNILKRLLGKNLPKPFVIDSVSKTSTGYCIVGWYCTSIVKKVALDSNGNKGLESQVTFIERNDVVAATGKPATSSTENSSPWSGEHWAHMSILSSSRQPRVSPRVSWISA